VDLAPLTDPGLVPLVTAMALGMRAIPGASATQALSEFIGQKNLLLVLDNCEHLIDAAAALAFDLLQACPHLHILATSVEVLGVGGEKPYRCPPLCLPDPDSFPTFPELAQAEAVRLFAERAQTASSGFRLTEANAPQITHICRRLDGIPLAIELAAARVRLLSIDQIAARLDNVFHLLTGGGRTALPRHQTLQALVDWSHNLLSENEHRLLRRLSVFAGGWTLEAAEIVCGGIINPSPPQAGAGPARGEQLLAGDVLDLLGGLVDKSLISVQVGTGAEPRYRMLEMIRQYAHQHLMESNEDKALREQHLDYYLALILQAESHLRARGSREWKERLEAEIDNVRLALEWSTTGSIEKGLRLAAALQWFWHGSRHRIEGVGWLNRLLAAEASGSSHPCPDPACTLARQIARGKALNASAYIGILVGQDSHNKGAEAAVIFESLGALYPTDLAYADYLSGEKSLLESLEMFRKIGVRFFISEMLLFLCQTSRWKGAFDQARTYAEEGLGLDRETGDESGEGGKLWELGMLEFLAGNLSQAMENFQNSQVCHFQSGSEEVHPFVYRFFAWIALVQDDIPLARQYSQMQLNLGSQYFIPWVISDALGFLGWEALTSGDENLAIQYCEEALKLAGRVDSNLLAMARYVLARVALARGEFNRAFTLLKAFVSENYHSWPPVQLGLQLYGILAAQQMANLPEQARRSATLFGAQAEINACLLNVIPLPERKAYEQALASVRAALSAGDFAAAFAEGHTMTTAQAIQFALDEFTQ
jgi:predicted ATPase